MYLKSYIIIYFDVDQILPSSYSGAPVARATKRSPILTEIFMVKWLVVLLTTTTTLSHMAAILQLIGYAALVNNVQL